MTINKYGLDARYTIALENSNTPYLQHVVRFCGEYAGGYTSLEAAKEGAFLDFLLRDLKNCGYTVLTECEGVTLFKGVKKNQFKVVYGAQVSDFSDIELAMNDFKYSVLHSLECESKLD